MTGREPALLALTAIGFAVPNAMLVAFVVEHGFAPGAYFAEWTASLPAAQLAADLLIAFSAFAVWSLAEGQRLGLRAWWLPVPAALLVGLCFALPLFLLMRERALAAATAEPSPAVR